MAGEAELLAAIGRGDLAAARAALDAGAPADARGPAGEPALVLAAMAGEAAIAGLLLDRGATADAADDAGNTALMHAAARGHRGLVELLLARGADCGRTNRWGLAASDWTRWAPDPAAIAGLIQANRS
jgi:ankyrin repeat protein